jgi:ABC-type sugar transport system substrate-binding protein
VFKRNTKMMNRSFLTLKKRAFLLHGSKSVAAIGLRLFVLCLLGPPIVHGKDFVIGFIDLPYGTQSQAIRAGAEDEIKELAKATGDTINLSWTTATTQSFDSAFQAMKPRVNAIAVSAAFAQSIVISNDNGLPVVMYGGPKGIDTHGNVVVIGADEDKCGKMLMEALAGVIQQKGLVAILSDNAQDTPMQQRVTGAQTQARVYPQIVTLDPVYTSTRPGTPPDPERTSSLMNDTSDVNHHSLKGWLSVINLAAFNLNSIKRDPCEVAIAAVASDVEQSTNAMQSGQVQVLLVYGYYQWGKECVRILYNQVAKDEKPETQFVAVDSSIVTKESLNNFLEKWNAWTRR